MLDHVSATEFVIRLVATNALQVLSKKLKSLAQVEEVTGHPGLYIAHLAEPAANPRSGWEQIRSGLGKAAEVFPVFLDEDQQPRYNAGTMQVRFPKSISDAE